MNQDELKRRVAEAALQYAQDGVIGVGSGSTVNLFIDALAIEMGADATDIGKTIHPHPTTSESVGMAAELYEGVCTDMPPQKKK